MCPERFPHRRVHRTRGAVTIELALCLTVFFMLVFGTMEVCRALYVFNTVQDVTREAARAASMTDFSSDDAMAKLRRRALFHDIDSDGALPLVPNLTTAQLRIEYLSMTADGTLATVNPMPACPQANVRNCTDNPFGPSCIRAVRASICRDAAGACVALPYQPMTGLVPGLAGMIVPVSATVVKAETLGYQPGANNCL